ncbi:MAG: orotate phosphoribosyltransferase [Longimicrobiales bacterium]
MTTAVDERERLLLLLRDRSFRTGDFVLSSGARASYYIDARLTTMSGMGQLLVGRTGLAMLDAVGWQPSAIGGLTLGADPVAYAIAHAAALAGRSLDAFTVRKEPKDHGTGRRIEGPLADGATVVVVEDVVTTGASALNAIDAVSEVGAHVLGVFALVDREQGGREKLLERGFSLVTSFRTSDLTAGAT